MNAAATGAPGSRRRHAMAAAGTLLAALALAEPARGALVDAGPLNPATHYPDFYNDGSIALQLCLDGPNCLATTADGINPPDGESFYWQATSGEMTGPDGQSATMELALEAAYLGAGDGQEITFGRIQMTMTGFAPDSDYAVSHPYGVGTWHTDAAGSIVGNNRAVQRHEVGCATTPCDFDAALATEIGPFLTWDPAVAPAPPDGFVGDAVTLHAVVGSPVDRNYVRIEGPGLPSGGIQTSVFTIQGELAGDPVAVFHVAPGSGDFGTQRAGGASVTRTITVKNNGLAKLPRFTSAAISGAGAGAFAIPADGCTGTSLGSGGSCAIDVTFTPPTALGTSTATLELTDESAQVHTVPLSGSAGAPGVSTDPALVDFLAQPVGTTSATRTVTVTNTGTVALNVTGAAAAGPDAAEFAVSANGCTAPVAPGGSCPIDVRFAPAAAGTRNASLSLAHDAATAPTEVPLTGQGTAASGSPPAAEPFTGTAGPSPGAGGGSPPGGSPTGGGPEGSVSVLGARATFLHGIKVRKWLRLRTVRRRGIPVAVAFDDPGFVALRLYRISGAGAILQPLGGVETHRSRPGVTHRRLRAARLRRALRAGRYRLVAIPVIGGRLLRDASVTADLRIVR